MALGLAAAGIGLASAGVKYYKGRKQQKEGEEALSGLSRPEYTIPQELMDNLSDVERQQIQGLPAEQKAEFVKNLERGQQSAMKQSASRKGGLLGVQASTSQQNDAYTNLVSMDAAARKESQLQKQSNIARARGAVAGAKDRQFDISSANYNQDLDSANAMIGAGMQNINNSIDTVGTTALGVMGTMGGAGAGSKLAPEGTTNTVGVGAFDENSIPSYSNYPSNYKRFGM